MALLGCAGRVLIVDDEAVVRDVASDILRSGGYDVDVAVDGRSGLRRLTDGGELFDVVLLDLTMPEISGEEVHRELARSDAAPVVIFSSGHSETDYVSEQLREGRATFLRKPYRAVDLLRAVAVAVSLNRQTDSS